MTVHIPTLTRFDQFLGQHAATLVTSESDHMVWCGDFNRHHSLWDEERNRHLLTASALSAAQPLISLLEDHNMIMLLPKGIPTLQSMSTGNWTRVDNVFATAGVEGMVVACDTDPHLRGPGMDHVPILTTLDCAVPLQAAEERRNFRNADWDVFRKELEEQLGLIPAPCALLTDAQFQRHILQSGCSLSNGPIENDKTPSRKA